MSLMRKALLAGSTSPWLREQATKRAFIRKSVSRFMPGETIDEALQAAKSLQPERITTILTRLGENLTKLDEAEEVTAHYLDVLDRVKRAGLDAQISVKPTQLGLDLDAAVCQRNLDRIVTHAEQAGNTPVWIDMESSPYVDPTLKLFRASREKSGGVGLAMQAYLYRTAKDLEDLIPLGPAVRIVKGAYLEPPDVAYPKKSDVDENFYTLCLRLMAQDAQKRGSLVHIATHDVALTDRLTDSSTRKRSRPRRTSSRCCSASSAASSSGSPRAAVGCACSSATANTGSRGTCDDSPSARPTSGSC